ncbi:MAG TPA: hypothetical protein VM577_05385 [Anaerovoracaceae bacterium]|nr:hypothetical protein [Anaerovoracaceae bacterium]
MNEKRKKIQDSFDAVYAPIGKAIGDCLVKIQNKDVDATAVISAIIAVSIDIAGKADHLAKTQGQIEMLIDGDHIARFFAAMMMDRLQLSDEVRAALDAVIDAGRDKPSTTAPGSKQLN